MAKVLDLFSGTGGWSQPWKVRGHDVLTVDWDESFGADIVMDARNLSADALLDYWGKPDIILASPPCESFSVGSFRHHWRALATCRVCNYTIERVGGERWQHLQEDRTHAPKLKEGSIDYTPKSATGEMGYALLRKTIELIETLAPAFFVIENPRALMRKMPELWNYERRTVTYCQYGKHYMKPTDLWGGFPPSLTLRYPCSNGDPCHEAAPRGAKTGTQGLTTAEAGAIPWLLALSVYNAAVEDMEVYARG